MSNSVVMKDWIIDAAPITVRTIDSAISIFKRHLDLSLCGTVKVSFDNRVKPICYCKEQNSVLVMDTEIVLACPQSELNRVIYQFSHELCHAIMRCRPFKGRFAWISECLCGAASYIVLDKASLLWRDKRYLCITNPKTRQPYWKDILFYLNNDLARVKVGLPSESEMPQFYKDHEESLATDPNGDNGKHRPRNDVFSYYYFKQIMADLSIWRAVQYIPEDDMSFKSVSDFLAEWNTQCKNDSSEALVRYVGGLIGIDFDQKAQ